MLSLTLLGEFSVCTGGEGAVDLPGQKDRALLAYLAASPGKSVTRTKLASLLWGNSGERQARDSLKQALLRLHRALDRAGASISADRQTVSLESSNVAVDALAFVGLLKDGTPEAANRAIELYRGDFLEDIDARSTAFDDWLLVERQRYRQMATEALGASLECALTASRRDFAATQAQRLLSLDPLHEGACRALMTLHAERGESAQALRLFENFRNRLQQELGVTPEPLTTALCNTIRRGRSKANQSSEADADPPPTEADPPDIVEETGVPSIAVLHFTNISGDPAQDYFSAGLTEDIVTDLSQIAGLRIVAHHRAPDVDHRPTARRLARYLAVQYLLDGSVRHVNDRVRISVRLIDGSSGGCLWADRFDRYLGDIFELQCEISKAIADVMRVRLLPGEIESRALQPANNPDAYQFYLMGRSFYLRGLDYRSLRIARDFYAKASEIDPLYARCHSGMAICDYYLSMNDPHASIERMFDCADRGIELAPNLGEAYAARGLALYGSGEYLAAADELDRAIWLDTRSFEAYFFQGRCSRLRGRREEAVRLFGRASELRPHDFRSLGLQAEEHCALGRVREFNATALRCLERVSSEVRVHPDNADAWAFGAAILAELGRNAQAEEWAIRAALISPDDSLVHYNVSRTYALTGKTDLALSWMARAMNSLPAFRNRLVAWTHHAHEFDRLRDNPRFTSLLAHA